MNTVCKVFFVTPGSDDWRHLNWMNIEPEKAIEKTLRKYKQATIKDTVVYTMTKENKI